MQEYDFGLVAQMLCNWLFSMLTSHCWCWQWDLEAVDLEAVDRVENTFFIIKIVLLLLTVRLGGSGLPLEGRLEVYYNGSWGTVCDDSFDIVDATVACRSINARWIAFPCKIISYSCSLITYFNVRTTNTNPEYALTLNKTTLAVSSLVCSAVLLNAIY